MQLRINCQLVLLFCVRACTFFPPLIAIFVCSLQFFALLIEIQKKLWKLRYVLTTSETLQLFLLARALSWTRFSFTWNSICNKVFQKPPFRQLLFVSESKQSFRGRLRRCVRLSRLGSINYQAQSGYAISIEAADRLNNRRSNAFIWSWKN